MCLFIRKKCFTRQGDSYLSKQLRHIEQVLIIIIVKPPLEASYGTSGFKDKTGRDLKGGNLAVRTFTLDP
jgi:hypothetical protein